MNDLMNPIILFDVHENIHHGCDVCQCVEDWQKENYKINVNELHELANERLCLIWKRMYDAYLDRKGFYDDSVGGYIDEMDLKYYSDKPYLFIKKKILTLNVSIEKEFSATDNQYNFTVFWENTIPFILRSTTPLVREKRLLKLWSQAVKGEYCDVSVRTEDGIFQVHKNVLASESEYFKKLIEFPREDETPFEIHINAEIKVATAFFEHLYTGELTTLGDPKCFTILDLYELFILGDFYQLENLVILSLEKITERTDLEHESLFLKIQENPIHEAALTNSLKSIERRSVSLRWFKKALYQCKRTFFDQLFEISKKHQFKNVNKTLINYAEFAPFTVES